MSGLFDSLGKSLKSAGFALLLLIVLLAINLVLSPTRFQPSSWGILIGLGAPGLGGGAA